VPALGSGVAANRKNVLSAIRNVSAELARASLSYLPGETPMGAASFSSDNLIASIRGLPDKKYSDGYARSYLAYKDRVETEYMDRFFQCAFYLGVFREAGQSFLHWSIEPEKMDFGTQGDSIYAGFELVLRIEDGRRASRSMRGPRRSPSGSRPSSSRSTPAGDSLSKTFWPSCRASTRLCSF
jgi:hypothetical protein